MKLSIASLSGSDFGLRHPGAPSAPARAASTSLLDDDDDVPTTLHRPRRVAAPGSAAAKGRGKLKPSAAIPA